MSAFSRQVKASLPGVFFAAEERLRVDCSKLLKSGELMKQGRSRAALSFIKGSSWKPRKICVFSSGNLQYFHPDSSSEANPNRPLGQVNITNSSVFKQSRSNSGRDHAFVIMCFRIDETGNQVEENLSLACSSEEEVDEWTAIITVIAAGKWHTLELSEVLCIPSPDVIDVIAESPQVLQHCLQVSGYQSNQMQEIFYGLYLEVLTSYLKELIVEDDSKHDLTKLIRNRMKSNKIFLQPFPADLDSSLLPYFLCSFTDQDELLIEFQARNIRTNITQLGESFVKLVRDLAAQSELEEDASEGSFV